MGLGKWQCLLESRAEKYVDVSIPASTKRSNFVYGYNSSGDKSSSYNTVRSATRNPLDSRTGREALIRSGPSIGGLVALGCLLSAGSEAKRSTYERAVFLPIDRVRLDFSI